MKTTYTFSSGEHVEADIATLIEQRANLQQYFQNYAEMFDNLDNFAYVARGNGFCSTQYSEEFIESQLAKYQRRLDDISAWIAQETATKKGLRAYIRAMKKRYSPAQLNKQAEEIMTKLEQHPLFIAAHTIMLYNSLPDEVCTTAFLQKWCATKQLVLPTVVGEDIVPVAITENTTFAIGDFQIAEPQSTPYYGNFDLIVVPGMAFDKRGNRLGRGKGYYDRFLSQHATTPTIGLCFDFQFVMNVPAEPHDISINEIITFSEN